MKHYDINTPNTKLLDFEYDKESEIFYFGFEYNGVQDSLAFNKFLLLKALFAFNNRIAEQQANEKSSLLQTM
jgi:hypothetical protein